MFRLGFIAYIHVHLNIGKLDGVVMEIGSKGM